MSLLVDGATDTDRPCLRWGRPWQVTICVRIPFHEWSFNLEEAECGRFGRSWRSPTSISRAGSSNGSERTGTPVATPKTVVLAAMPGAIARLSLRQHFHHCPLDVEHRRIEERKTGRLRAAQEQRQLGPGENHAVDAVSSAR